MLVLELSLQRLTMASGYSISGYSISGYSASGYSASGYGASGLMASGVETSDVETRDVEAGRELAAAGAVVRPPVAAALPARWRRLGLAALLGAAALAPSQALAQAPAAPAAAPARDPAAVARADAAFEEGRELFDQGRFREACEKFELSMQLDPSPGTLLNLGNCYEPQGDLVRALAIFEQAFADAQRSSDPRRKELWTDAARERIAALSRRVPQLSVRDEPPDAEVAIDGAPVARASGALRINPGHHRLEVRAPGKRPYTHEFDISAGQRLAINVPPLEVDSSAPAAAPLSPSTPESAPPQDRSSGATYGVWPYVLGGTGAALLGTSLITGLMASSKASKLDRECPDDTCDLSLRGTRDSAESLALATDVLWISGLIVAGAGVTLFILDANDDEPATALQAGCFASGCGLLASGRF